MPISKQAKEKLVKNISAQVEAAKSVVVSAFTALSVNDDQALRGELRSAGIAYQVIKKTLLKKILESAKYAPFDLANVLGNVSVATSQDEVSAAKVMHKFAKGRDNVSIVAGYLETVLIDQSKIADLAELPSREELLAKTLATFNAPAQNFVSLLSAIPRSLLHSLNAIKEQKSSM